MSQVSPAPHLAVLFCIQVSADSMNTIFQCANRARSTCIDPSPPLKGYVSHKCMCMCARAHTHLHAHTDKIRHIPHYLAWKTLLSTHTSQKSAGVGSKRYNWWISLKFILLKSSSHPSTGLSDCGCFKIFCILLLFVFFWTVSIECELIFLPQKFKAIKKKKKRIFKLKRIREIRLGLGYIS